MGDGESNGNMSRVATRLEVGALAPPFTARTLANAEVKIPYPSAMVHLSFRRFAGCPICNLHLRSLARRHDELESAGIREVALFHSEAETMRRFQADFPFDVIADPEREIYARYGVTTGVRSILDPRAWPAFFRGTFARHPSSNFTGEGGHTGLPADFLISPDGAIKARHYGKHADDQWSIDEIVRLAST